MGGVMQTNPREIRARRDAAVRSLEQERRRIDAIPAETARRAVALAIGEHGMELDTAMRHLYLGQLSMTGEAIGPGPDAAPRVAIADTRVQQLAILREADRVRRSVQHRRVAAERRRQEAQRLLDAGAEPRDEVGMVR